MLNPGLPKCHDDLITLGTNVHQSRTMNNIFFIGENIKIFGYLGA